MIEEGYSVITGDQLEELNTLMNRLVDEADYGDNSFQMYLAILAMGFMHMALANEVDTEDINRTLAQAYSTAREDVKNGYVVACGSIDANKLN